MKRAVKRSVSIVLSVLMILSMCGGPCVLICHNQCILSPERSVCNYGKKKVSTEEVLSLIHI